ncbi:MAG: tetratricopeptide repeat protein [Tannerellaceae bacterium]|jgi:tetratricopeptide (TPR) repeat protein|nr:tetratricopeptide repeat protein [Tannerellaceae bacterium]
MNYTHIYITSFLAFLLLLLQAGGALRGQSYEELVRKSYDYLDRDDLPAAEVALKEAMRMEPANPNNYALLSNLGTIQRRQGKYEDAIASYSISLGREPKNVMILGNRASLYLEIGDAERALADYNLVLVEDSINQDALYNRGLIYLQKKNFLWAEQDFDRLLQINEYTFYGRLGHAVLEKARGNYDESERIYSYLIDKMPRELQLYRGRADLYFLMGKNARAMADINRVFADSSPDADAYILRGKIKLAQYEKEAAVRDFLKAKELGYDAVPADELLRLARYK